MSSGTNSQTRVGILAPDIDIPTDDPDLFREIINEREKETSIILSQKENGIYPLVEVQTSQLWFSSNVQRERDGFRTVYETGALSTGINNIAHGLTITNFTFTHVFGVITDGTDHVLLPNGDGGTGESANVSIDGTNIVITITVGYNGFSGHITLEYVKTAT